MFDESNLGRQRGSSVGQARSHLPRLGNDPVSCAYLTLMNTKLFSRRIFSSSIVAAAALVAGVAGCSKQDRAEANATAKEAYSDTKAAMSKGWDNVKSFTYDRRDEFNTNAKAMSAQLDAQLSELRADYSEAKASASRKAAMAELKDSEADYKQKVDALGNATASTWDSAKQNVIAAWDRVQAAYLKARAD